MVVLELVLEFFFTMEMLVLEVDCTTALVEVLVLDVLLGISDCLSLNTMSTRYEMAYQIVYSLSVTHIVVVVVVRSRSSCSIHIPHCLT